MISFFSHGSSPFLLDIFPLSFTSCAFKISQEHTESFLGLSFSGSSSLPHPPHPQGLQVFFGCWPYPSHQFTPLSSHSVVHWIRWELKLLDFLSFFFPLSFSFLFSVL